MVETRRASDGVTPPLTQSSLRLRNLWRVLGVIREAGTTSRVRIAAETGLTGTTVHRLTDELLRRRLVTPGAAVAPNGIGRPSTMYRFNGQIGHVVGIDVGNETSRAVLADLDGILLARLAHPTASIEGNLPRGLEEMVSDLQRECSMRPESLVAIGVGIAGVTEPEGTIVRASMHHLWEGLQLGVQLRRDLGCEVIVSQDDHLAALAELEVGGCLGLRDALVVNVGKGVGAGVISDGAVHRGAHGAAGRVGWIAVDAGLPAEGDPSGTNGERSAVPLATYLTADGLISEYQRLGGQREVDGAREVFVADVQGDAAATQAIDAFADRLGWLIGTTAAIVDPQRVVVGGGISGSFDRLAPRIVARVAETVALPPPIIASSVGNRCGRHGRHRLGNPTRRHLAYGSAQVLMESPCPVRVIELMRRRRMTAQLTWPRPWMTSDDTSRFARNIEDAYAYRRRIAAAGVTVVFCADNLIAGNVDTYELEGLKTVADAAYIRRLSRNVGRGYEQKWRLFDDPGRPRAARLRAGRRAPAAGARRGPGPRAGAPGLLAVRPGHLERHDARRTSSG